MGSDDFTYNREDVQVIGDKQMQAHGVQVDSVNVGTAKNKEVYLSYEHNTVQNYSLEHFKQGNVVKVSYRKRSVKTPYRIAYLDIKDSAEDEWNGDGWTTQEFTMVLEPFNNRAATLLLYGRRRCSSKRRVTEWLASQKDSDNETDELISYIQNGEESEKFMIRRVGDSIDNLHRIKPVSDKSIMNLLNVKDPAAVPMMI